MQLTLVPLQVAVAHVGDFNGDGRTDILWRNDDGRLTDWLGATNGGFYDNVQNANETVPTAWQVASIGDFKGDGRDDILWRNADGRLTDWLGATNGGSYDNVQDANEIVPTAWHVQLHASIV